jgi:hypothetical protein
VPGTATDRNPPSPRTCRSMRVRGKPTAHSLRGERAAGAATEGSPKVSPNSRVLRALSRTQSIWQNSKPLQITHMP